MAAETQYTANTGKVTISTGNSNLDGTTGTYYTVLTAAGKGTLIKTITIKAQGNTAVGMVRLFAYDGTNTKIIAEIPIPAITQSAINPAFEKTIELNYFLKGVTTYGILKASTENSETFSVIAQGLDFDYYTTSVRPESTNYTAQSGMVTISTANSNLDGTTGTYGTVYSCNTGKNGCLINSINIKAQGNTTKGVVRLFLSIPGATTQLISEVPIPSITIATGVTTSFSHRIDFDGKGFAMTSGVSTGWAIKASTQNGESFNVFAEVLEWVYPA